MTVYRHEVPGNRRKIKRLRYDGKYDTSHASTCRAISFWACAKSQAVLAYLVLQLLFAAEPGRRKTRCASVPYHCGQPLTVLFHTLFPRPIDTSFRGAQPPASSIQGGCSPLRPPASYASDSRCCKRSCPARITTLGDQLLQQTNGTIIQ